MTRFILTLALCGMTMYLTAAEPIPVARWTFDTPDSKVIQPALGTTPGKLLPGGDYEFMPGVSGRALRFGAKTGGMMLGKLPLDLTRPFTIAVTLKLAPEAAQPAAFRAFKDIWGNGGTRGPGVRLTIFYGGVQFNSGDGAKSDSFITRPAEYAIPLDRWFQLTTVYDGKKVTLYADGQAIAAKEMTVTASPRALCIGSNNGSAYPLPGAIDDLAIYDRALTPEEVAALALDRAE